MRKKHCLTIGLFVLLAVAAYWYWHRTPIGPKIDPEKNPGPVASRPGDVIEAEEIEPIVVDRGFVARPEAMPDDGPMPVVRLEPGMKQPARPDAEFAPQMPLADEPDVLGLRRNPIASILDPTLARLNIFDGIEESEEPESKNGQAPRTPDYHRDQCPHHTGRPMPPRE
jgi:hypothetical protein